MIIVLSVSVLGTSVAIAKPQKVFQPSATPSPLPFPHHTPGQSWWTWVSQVMNWVGLFWQWLMHAIHFR